MEVRLKSERAGQKCCWMVSTDTYSSESDGVHGNPTESILVHRNYWSCDKPNLKQVQYKPDMPRS